MTEQQRESLLGTVLAVIGFLLIAGIAVWGLTHMLTIAKDITAPWFSKSQTIVISVPAVATTSSPVFISWKHTATAPGSYAFLYSCVSGVRFETETANGVTKIPCGAAYSVGTSSLEVIPQLTVGSRITTPITILFKPAATAQTLGSFASSAAAEGSSMITVVRGTSQAPQSMTKKQVETKKTPTIATSYSSDPVDSTEKKAPVRAKATPVATTPADLAVTIVSVGVIDSYTGAFVARQPYSPDEIAVVTFDIKNTGGRATGAYRFTVELPTETAYTYYSPTQASLSAGSHVVNTLKFDRFVGGTVHVSVDTSNQVSESNEKNNSAEWSI